MYTFEEFRKLDGETQFNYFMEHLAFSNKNADYFVNWPKVYNNTREVSMALNAVNYLLGKENIKEEAYHLFSKYPELLKVVPVLIATRDKKFQILENTTLRRGKELTYLDLNFLKIDESKIEDYIEFMEEVGLLELISNGKIKNLEDYVMGVEVGLDSNGRKNRSGHIMEDLIESALTDMLDKERYEYLKEANAGYIKSKTGFKIPVNKNNRRFDFVVHDKLKNKLVLIEVNFYNGGGSKLKSVAGEFTTQHRVLKEHDMDNVSFVWITDGPGWESSSKPLEEAYEEVDHIINLHMVSEGYLDRIIDERKGEQF